MEALGLSRYAQRFFSEGAPWFLESLSCPLLVWTVRGADAEGWVKTQSQLSLPEPTRGEPLVFELRKDPERSNPFALGVTLGRTANNDIVVPHPSVSRFHGYFQLDPRNQGWTLTDAESKNGSFSGDQRLIPTRPLALADASRLRFGEADVRFYLREGFLSYLKLAMAG